MSFNINVTNYYAKVALTPIAIKDKEYLYKLDRLSYIREANKVIVAIATISSVASMVLGFDPTNAVVFATVSAVMFFGVNSKLRAEDLRVKMLLNTIENKNGI